MNQNLRKLKGYTFKLNNEQIVLKEICRQNQSSRDEIFYLTNIENMLCKIIDFENQVSVFKYKKQKMLYENLSQINSVLKLIYFDQIQYKKLNFGLLVFDKVKRNSSLAEEMTNLKQQSQIIAIVKEILNFLIQLDLRSLAYLNLSPDNILLNIENLHCIINFEKVVNTGITQNELKNNYFLNESIEQGFKYISPEMLDSFSKQIINWRADIFCLGCLIYELCYKKYPYNTPLSVINMSYTIPVENMQNFKILNKIIKKCLIDVNLRPKAKDLLKQINSIQNESKKLEIKQNVENENVQNNFFQQFKNALNKFTKQSQSWILDYIQQNQKQPEDKFIQLLLTKVYKNKQKLQKIYSIIIKYTVSRINNKFTIYKTLCLLFNFMRRGPKQVISLTFKNNLKQINDTIFKNYMNQITVSEMCKINKLKFELIQLYGQIFEGNFHLIKIENINKFNPTIIQNLLKYIFQLLSTYQKLQTIKSIGNYIKNYYLDQIYDLIVVLIITFISILKDIQIKKRRQPYNQRYDQIQLNLEKILRQINKLYKPNETHIINTLQSTLMNYKYNIHFESFDNIKISVFQLFYKRDKVYMNLSIPIDLQNLFLKSKQENLSMIKNNSCKSIKSIKSLNSNKSSKQNENSKSRQHLELEFFSQEQNIQTQIEFENIFEKKSKSNIKQNFDKGAKQNHKDTTAHQIFQMWNKDRPSLNKKQQKKINENKFDLFAEFKQPTTPKLDFDVIWKVDQPISTQKLTKKQVSFEQFEILAKDKISQKKQNDIFALAMKSTEKKQKVKETNNVFYDDLLDFNIKSEVKKPDKNVVNKDLFYDFLLDKPKNNLTIKNKQLQQLESEILKCMKQQKLKELLKNSKLIIQFQAITFNKIIGCGSAGQVFEGVYNNKIIAIKKIKSQNQNPNAFKQFQRQLITLIRIGKHENLVSLIGITKKNDEFYLLMDYCEGGNLFELLHKRTDLSINWRTRINIAKQIALGMNYLHQSKPQIIHRDLKSLNVLIQNKYNPNQQKINIKVTDFGLSRNPDAQYMTSALGTLHWMAPQLLQGKSYSLKVDIYSFGIVLWQICCRQTPYKQFKTPHSIMKYVIMDGGRPSLNKLNIGYNEELRKLMIRCWSLDENMRPDFKQVLRILSNL